MAREETGKTPLKKIILVIGVVILTIVGFGIFTYIVNEFANSGTNPGIVKKPNIYLYSNVTVQDTIRIDVPNGRVVTSDPLAHHVNVVEWEVTITPDGMFYDNEQIPWLFYEAEIDNPAVSTNMGWYFERCNETITTNNVPYSIPQFVQLFAQELCRIGLFAKEAQDFVDYWFSLEHILVPEDGKYTLILADEMWVNSNLQLSTGQNYDVLRIFLVLNQVFAPVTVLAIPNATNTVTTGLILHEWGVIC
ncbi:MAG: hypothetical protein RBG13Loki_1273 [Promethearchaeota archaeon CR_4]|nr:MAG: hypothetical protein RBG13Loki_1273 [Candidatus Lokiarchaeota archaeon CR_4]